MPDYLREYYNENGQLKLKPENFDGSPVKITDELASPTRSLSPVKEDQSSKKVFNSKKNVEKLKEKVDVRAPKIEIISHIKNEFQSVRKKMAHDLEENKILNLTKPS